MEKKNKKETVDKFELIQLKTKAIGKAAKGKKATTTAKSTTAKGASGKKKAGGKKRKDSE
jgi:hypothetical protein